MDCESAIVEEFVDFQCELSVVGVRSGSGQVACYDPILNEHKNHILDVSVSPSGLPDKVNRDAMEIAASILDTLGMVGVMCVEMFLTRDGRLIVNELAPRPHNSGHLTIEAHETSQFEQQVRMVCDLPFGHSTLHTPVVMTNLLGDVWGEDEPDWASLLAQQENRLHLYGKHEARPGRKMGHYCTLHTDLPTALASAEQTFTQLEAAAQQTANTVSDTATGSDA